MNIHWLQHVPFEGLGCIDSWLNENGHTVSCTRLWNHEVCPDGSAIDGLIVMGGPMGIYDEAEYPWLADEKRFIKQVIEQDRPVLGICLGAQLIAGVLGARVWKNSQKEIGFFPLKADGRYFPQEFTAFHWHGDTFGIPDEAVRLASSAATENQAFICRDRVLGLQFHLETTEQSLLSLYRNCEDEITAGEYIQTLDEMSASMPVLENCNRLMFDLLKRLF